MKKAFTLTELLVVIGIMAILGTIAVPIYGSLQVQSQLNETGDFIIQAIRMTKQNAEARYHDSYYGIKFLKDSFVSYQGKDYDTRNKDYDRQEKIDSAMILSTNLENDEIIFSRGLAEPDNFGVVTITHSDGRIVNININSWGIVEVN
jgi:prepilin-type N-terminal cleavage/methylation domain-containing protein